MCHLILLLPVLAVPVFWLMPATQAIPLYLIIMVVSGLLYWYIARSLGKRPQTGRESLIGVAAEVVSKIGPAAHAQYLVRAQGELWSADSSHALRTGEKVRIAAVDGIRLVVRRDSPLDSTNDGVRNGNEWHCH